MMGSVIVIMGEAALDGFGLVEERWDMECKVGDLFMSKKDFIIRVKEYSLKGGFCLKRKKNDDVRFIVYCGASRCKWRLHASVMDDEKTFGIKTYNRAHRCIRHVNN